MGKVGRVVAWLGLGALSAVACMAPPVGRAPARELGGEPDEPARRVWTTAVEPKPIGDAARRGIAWLVERQRADGGWTQGEESAHVGGDSPDRSNVGDSCAALLALLRSGASPAEGELAGTLGRGVAFVCGKVEQSDEESLAVTDVTGTRLQAKIGANVDTFLASLALAEIKGRMATPEENARVDAALAKVLRKMERHQRSDGSWQGAGWAPVLGKSIAYKGLNRAAQNAAGVPQEVLALGYANLGGAAGAAPAADAAGIALYAGAAQLGELQESANTMLVRESELRGELARTDSAERRERIEKDLDGIADFRKVQGQAQEAMLDRLDDPVFVAGFGSNGGEEFLSYMNISESLVVRADDDWRRWDQAISANLERVQNADGSWSGHHCITGRTFCTSAALLVLLADRTPVPAELVAKR
jgi:hypothetical protein